jgi:hypothetical protein
MRRCGRRWIQQIPKIRIFRFISNGNKNVNSHRQPGHFGFTHVSFTNQKSLLRRIDHGTTTLLDGCSPLISSILRLIDAAA